MLGLFTPSLERRRAKAAARASGALADYYRTPVPTDDTPWTQLRLLAIDVETTGLDPEKDQLLSLGWVPVDGDVIDLSGATHIILQAATDVGQSAVYHGITDDQLAGGVPVADAMVEVLRALAGRVLLAHYANIEVSFLSRVCQQLYGAPLEVPVVDTLVLHDKLINKGFDDESTGNMLRLWTARGRYGLPRYGAHEALTDAVACAELYLGQVSEANLVKPQTYKTLRKP